EPEYTVTVPETVSMGTLSADKDTAMEYSLNVDATNLNGTLTISAPAAGSLTNGDNTLAFANSFGSQSVTEDVADKTLSGKLTVSGADVAKAAAGNYTRTTTFMISYAAN